MFRRLVINDANSLMQKKKENSLFPISCPHVDFLPAWSSIIATKSSTKLIFYLLFARDCTVCTSLVFTRSFSVIFLPFLPAVATCRFVCYEFLVANG